MFDNGYIFTKDIKRIFINTCLGCMGKCSYCYLSQMGYSNQALQKRMVSSDFIFNCIKENKIEINKDTLITLGCYSECWDENNKKETIKIIKYFLQKGNQVQLSTKKLIDVKDLSEIMHLIKYRGQLVIFVSMATITYHDRIENNTTLIEERIKNFKNLKELDIPIVLYIKPVLKGVTIKDLDLFKSFIINYKIKDVVIGTIFTLEPSKETIHFSDKNKLFYNEVDDEKILINELSKFTNVFTRSTQVMQFYKK